MTHSQPDTSPRHPIGVVSTRTGLPQDLIRAWERRYQAVTPHRSETGRRLYSDKDVERLKLLRRCVSSGRRISDVAQLDVEQLVSLAAEDAAEGAPAAHTHAARSMADSTSQDLLRRCITATDSLDRRGLERALSDASVTLSSPRMRRELIAPLLETIGERWREGTIRIAQEHLATSIVRTFLGSLTNANGNDMAPVLVVTTPAGQQHELGALMAAGAADEAGWNVVYLGPSLPAEEVAAAVRQLKASAVALSVVYQENESHTIEELRRLRGFLDPEVPIFVGGRASAALRQHLGDIDVFCLEDANELLERLTSLHN